MTYDLIYFYDECDLLEIRMSLLDRYVDYFIVVEGTETYRGEKKPMYFDSRYDRWKHKTIHHIVKDMPRSFNDPNCDQGILNEGLHSSNVTFEHICWLREFYFKEHGKIALKGLYDDDLVSISDCDEIYRPRAIKAVKKGIYRPIQLPYLYFLNQRTSQPYTDWTGTVISRYKNIKGKCLNHLRTHSKTKCKLIPNGGWHFGLLGDNRAKRLDAEPTGYSEVFIRGKEIELRIDESDLPKWLLNNKHHYAHLFKN